MSKAPAQHYKIWTPTEIKALKKFVRQKLSLTQIAKEMKRTTWSIRNRASREGISLRTD